MSLKIQTNGLVLYKSRPAVVRAIADKIDIEFDGGSKRVREKDVQPLHPGPVAALPGSDIPAPLLDDARELLIDESVSFEDFAALLYGEYTPENAWGAWQLLNESLYFIGDFDAVQARPAELVEAEIAQREAREREKVAWDEMLERLAKRKMVEDDRDALAEVERVALGQSELSRIMDALEISISPQNAHRLLLQVGYWDEQYNPYPQRFGIHWGDNLIAVPPPRSSDRTDLTSLPAYAIDDVGSEDPDDAISIQNNRLYVHVADAASIVTPDSVLDREARLRGANLYLPDRILPMLPHPVTQILGLGLNETSPALTISFEVDDAGEIDDIQIELSQVAVTRASYQQVDEELQTTFAQLKSITDRLYRRRQHAGAASIDLPEVNLRVTASDIFITPYQRGGSRQVVTEAMLAAGEAVARFATQHGIIIPYAIQSAPDEIRQPQLISEMFAYRRLFKPSRATLEADRHFGLGLPMYTRTTSPLRRYLDLVTHQQLHAWLNRESLLDEAAMSERIAAAQASGAAIRKSERFSNQHWKLVYLQRNRDWQGQAVVAELEDRKMTLIVPELALEIRQRRLPELDLDQAINVSVDAVNLSDLEVRFRIIT